MHICMVYIVQYILFHPRREEIKIHLDIGEILYIFIEFKENMFQNNNFCSIICDT